MGIYRLLLSIFVAFSHMGITFFGYNPGVFAVVSFFLLSGYAMRILIEKYYKKPFFVIGFYIDRTVKLFPQFIFYLIVATICIHFELTSDNFDRLTASKWLLQLLILPINFYMYKDWLLGAFIIPQTWSLGLEITFYLIVPWIVQYLSLRSTTILLMFSIGIFFVAYSGKINSDWYGYRLLPGTLFIFLVGTLYYQKDFIHLALIASVFSIAGVLFFIAYQHEALYKLPYNKEVLAGLLFGIPAIGMLKNYKFSVIDEFFGNLSYGVFLNHLIIIWLTNKLFLIKDIKTHAAIVIIFSCLLSFVSYLLIERPALRWRHKFRSGLHHRWKIKNWVSASFVPRT